MRLGDRVGARFTFFVNMGYSFNWRENLRHLVAKRRGRGPAPSGGGMRHALPTRAKLGTLGVLKTVFLNPKLGERYRPVFDTLYREGHELGLHGGTDHVVWQRALPRLSEEELEGLLLPAYETFSARYGAPKGFASPGFQFNTAVLRLLDRLGFLYASDMPGEVPFRPEKGGGESWDHYQVPVNVAGDQNVPLIEEGLGLGLGRTEIVGRCVAEIEKRDFALLYGHPYVEGVHSEILGDVLEEVSSTHDVMPASEYLERWRSRSDA